MLPDKRDRQDMQRKREPGAVGWIDQNEALRFLGVQNTEIQNDNAAHGMTEQGRFGDPHRLKEMVQERSEKIIVIRHARLAGSAMARKIESIHGIRLRHYRHIGNPFKERSGEAMDQYDRPLAAPGFPIASFDALDLDILVRAGVIRRERRSGSLIVYH